MVKRVLLAVVLGILPSLQEAQAELAPQDYTAMVERAVTDYVGPASDNFSAAATRQAEVLNSLCEAPSDDALQQARSAFVEVALAWAALEYLDLDPWREDDRGPRIYFFPDRKGVTGRHVRRALQNADPALLEADALAQASVALQGLPALEYLLYGKGFEALSTSGGDGYRCKLALSIAANLVALAGELQEAWRLEALFVQALLAPTADGIIARTPKEAATLLFGRVPAGLLSLEERKVMAPLGSELAKARPLRANYALSGITNQVLAANLEGLTGLLLASGAQELIAARDAALAEALDPAKERVLSALSALPLPLGEAAADPAARDQVHAFLAAVGQLRVTAGEDALQVLGLRTYLRADDGD